MTGSEMDQADAGAPVPSEKVSHADEKQPDVFCCISSDAIYEVRRLLNAQNVRAAAFIDDNVGNAIAQRNILAGCLLRMRELIDAALTEARVTISNESERDAVSLNQSLHHTQSKEG